MNICKSGFHSLKMPFYAVRLGRNPGIYLTWDEARKNVEGFHGAVHKKFSSQSEADTFLRTTGGYSKPTTSLPSTQASVPKQRPEKAKPAFSCSYQEANSSQSSVSSSSLKDPSFGSHSSGDTNSLGSQASVATNSNSDAKYNLVMYTDGACKGNQNVHEKSCPAGWGAVVLTGSHEVVAEIYAPVELYAASPYYLGAEVKSNNTAELSAIGESLIYLRDTAKIFSCNCTSECRCPKGNVVIRYDSEYAAKSVMGLFNGEKNKSLYTNIRRIYESVKKGGTYAEGELGGQRRRPIDVKFEKVKGHSGDTWNDRADHLANEGARGLTCGVGRYKGCTLKRPEELDDMMEPHQNKKLKT
jgi:ribonuclease HI